MITIVRGGSLGWWSVLVAGLMFACAAALVVGIALTIAFEDPGWDSRYAYYSASSQVLDGRSPYPDPGQPIDVDGKMYVYPPQLAFLFSPLTVFPVDVAAGLAVVGSLAALIAALAVLGVRDVRCYAAVLLWAPAWNAIENANVSAALVLGVALVWRWRRTVWPLGAALGLAVSVKIFLWPLLVWVVMMKRLRAAVLGVAVGVGVTLAAWWAIGFQGFFDYPELVGRLAETMSGQSYSITSIAAELGMESSAGTALSVLIGGGLLVGGVSLGRGGDDLRAFTCCLAAAIALTPIVWQHYFALLVVPLAVARPRFSALWLLPALLWLSPRVANGDGLQPFLPALVTAIVLAALLARPRVSTVAAEAA